MSNPTDQPSASAGHRPAPPARSTGAAPRRDPNASRPTAPVLIQPVPGRAPSADRPTDDDGPSVLLVRGGSGLSLIWSRVEPLLCAHGFGVRTVVQGRDDEPGVARLGDLDQVDDALELARRLDEQQAEPAVIVGHGFGAGMALALAAQAPRCARALVLVAPALQPGAIPAADRVLATPFLGATVTWLAFRVAGAALHVPSLRRRLLLKRAGLTAAQADRAVRSFSRGPTWRRFTVEQRQLVGDAQRVRRLLDQVACPTYIVAGRGDRIAPFPIVSGLVAQLAGAQLITSDAGHLIPIDDPDAVLDAVQRAHGHAQPITRPHARPHARAQTRPPHTRPNTRPTTRRAK
jgi:pimeloyl-ACP methyl ester carboxylesterase